MSTIAIPEWYSHTEAMGPHNILETVPPEFIINIIAYMSAEDDLANKLTSKTMNNFVPESFESVIQYQSDIRTDPCLRWDQWSWPPTAKVRAISVHRQLEYSIHRFQPDRQLKHLLYMHCGCIRPRAECADSQQRRLRTGFDKARLIPRRCLRCTIRHYSQSNRWHKCKCFKVEGNTKFVCAHCVKILPIGDEETRDMRGCWRAAFASKPSSWFLAPNHKFCKTCHDKVIT